MAWNFEKVTIQKSIAELWTVIQQLAFQRPSLLNQKHNVGWFQLRRFVDLLRVCSLHSISRKHPNTFCSLTCRKQKFVQSNILQQRAFCSDIKIVTGFCLLLNVHFNKMQIDSWKNYLSRSLWEFSFTATCSDIE